MSAASYLSPVLAGAMGKRSTSTTKSGKYMNPTDQARKEARKRELKKNKKQRQMVRAAVLKGKNPRELIVELEKIDDMEFNPLAPPPLNEKVTNFCGSNFSLFMSSNFLKSSENKELKP